MAPQPMTDSDSTPKTRRRRRRRTISSPRGAGGGVGTTTNTGLSSHEGMYDAGQLGAHIDGLVNGFAFAQGVQVDQVWKQLGIRR